MFLDRISLSIVFVYTGHNDHSEIRHYIGLGMEGHFLVLLGVLFNHDWSEPWIWNYFIGKSLSKMHRKSGKL